MLLFTRRAEDDAIEYQTGFTNGGLVDHETRGRTIALIHARVHYQRALVRGARLQVPVVLDAPAKQAPVAPAKQAPRVEPLAPPPSAIPRLDPPPRSTRSRNRQTDVS